MRVFLLASFLFILADTQAKGRDTSQTAVAKYKLKLNLLDQTYFSLPTIKISNEFLIEKKNFPTSVSLDFGYTFYSVDEQVKAKGYYLGARYNFYLNNRFNKGHGASFGFFYQNTTLNDYLKVSYTLPGLGTYQQYEKMKYHKERFGFSLEYFAQFFIGDNLFIEPRGGPGLLYMRTITLERVTQNTHVNGLYFGKEILTPTFFFNFKIGYLFF